MEIQEMKKVILAFLFAGLSSLLTACGGGSSDTNTAAPALTPTPTPVTATYTVGGSASGLNGSLTIKNNSTDQLIVTSTGSFTFATPVTEGGQYNVTITTQPSTQTCTLSNASGTNITSNVSSISISCSDNPPGTTSLSLNTTTLALKTSGFSRNFMVTNNGQDPALSINIMTSPTLPTGTVQSTTCGASLAPGSSCSITITPGSTPSASAPQAPAASTLTIAGSNTNSLNADVYVLTYGNIYQSGYIYSFDDGTSATNSVGGKVLAVVSEFGTQNWSQSATQCTSKTTGSYTNWYVPAICEMNSLSTATCVPQTDIQTQLVNTGISPLTGAYWSSTQSSGTFAWFNNFTGAGSTNLDPKSNFHSTICAREMTN